MKPLRWRNFFGLILLLFGLAQLPMCSEIAAHTPEQRAANAAIFAQDHPELDRAVDDWICSIDTAKHGHGNEVNAECR